MFPKKYDVGKKRSEYDKKQKVTIIPLSFEL